MHGVRNTSRRHSRTAVAVGAAALQVARRAARARSVSRGFDLNAEAARTQLAQQWLAPRLVATVRSVSPATAGRTERDTAATDRATHGRAQATQLARN
jgi:hypothetical protein